MGRPTKLTPEVKNLILEALRGGNTRAASAEHAGIPRETMSRWMDRFVTFRHEVIRAEAEAEVKAVTTLREAYEAGDWRAAFAWLERRRHEDWGRQDRLEIIRSVREMATREGLPADKVDDIVAGAERYLRDLRRGARS